jgi:hypothetical protein
LRLRSAAAIAASVLFLVAGACGGGSADRVVLTPVPLDKPLVIVVSRDMEIGDNRFVLGLVDQRDESQILGADLHLRFFYVTGAEQTLKSEADPEALRITKTYTHTHEDGTVETHEAGESGAYVSAVDFDAAGDWGVEVTGTRQDGRAIEASGASFNVLEESAGLDPGDPAPRSVQRVLRDVSDITEIDTSQTPIPEMHDRTIAEAVTSGRPTVIAFATPAFCSSQVCGSTKDIVDDLYATYSARANFVHVEPYDLTKARTGEGLVTLPFLREEWRLISEPWVFVVDAAGVISAEFDGIVSYEELERALAPLVS